MLLSLPIKLLLLFIGDTHPLVYSRYMTSEGRRFRQDLPAELAGVILFCGAALFFYNLLSLVVCGVDSRLIAPVESVTPENKRLRLNKSDQGILWAFFILLFFFQ